MEEEERPREAGKRTGASHGRSSSHLPADGTASTGVRPLTSAGEIDTPDQKGDPQERPEIKVALDVLMIMGRLGQRFHDALVTGASTDLVGNSEVIVVCSLSLRGSLRPSDIVKLTGLSSGGVTKLIDRLEADGLIVRALGTYPDDRRATRLALSPRGSKVAHDFARAVLSEMDAIRSGFTELIAATEPVAAAEDGGQ